MLPIALPLVKTSVTSLVQTSVLSLVQTSVGAVVGGANVGANVGAVVGANVGADVDASEDNISLDGQSITSMIEKGNAKIRNTSACPLFKHFPYAI